MALEDAGGPRLSQSESCDPEELLAAARAGGRAGFATLVRLQQARVYSIAVRMVMDREQAQDLAQDVFLQLHLSLDSIESHAHLMFWLRQVTTRRAIDQLRQGKRAETVALDEKLGLSTQEAPDDPLLRQHLTSLIGELPATARAIMLLRYQEDLDPLDIARILEMPINTVKSHLKRSLATLRARLPGLRLDLE